MRYQYLLTLVSFLYLGSSGSLAVAQDIPAIDLSKMPIQSDPTTVLPLTKSTLQPTFIGVYINGQERDSLDVYYDPEAKANESRMVNEGEGQNSEAKRGQTNLSTAQDTYFFAIADLERLTATEFVLSSDDTQLTNSQLSDSSLSNTASPNSPLYQVKTPIGDTELTSSQVQRHNGQNLLGLSTLKQFGISANYNQQDLAIMLNMGWQPKKVLAARQAKANHTEEADTVPVDYYPSKAGLLGLSVNSGISINESKAMPSSGSDDANAVTASTRQAQLDIGAFGHAFGGIWGVRGSGAKASDVDNTHNHHTNRDNFAQQVWTGLTDSPWEITDWHIDNLYWAKAGEKVATRLGTSQPNGLGQGAQVTGAEFTGALVAYSNRSIARHLTIFDDNSRSLLQNTSQDYQNFDGIAEPGGVAELRINGRAVARVQIGLDGRYEFLNLDVQQLNLADTLVEIAIFAYPLAREPLEIRPLFLGQRRSNVATDEVLLEAGVGLAGNTINNNINNNANNINNDEAVAHLYAEYGLNNRIAIRGGINSQYKIDRNDRDRVSSIPTRMPNEDDLALSWFTGINFTPTTNSNADLSYAHSSTQALWQAQLQYQRSRLNANYHYQARQYRQRYLKNNRNLTASHPEQKKVTTQRHHLALGYKPTDQTTITLNQYYNDSNQINTINDDRYYAYTSINHRFNKGLDASLNWNTRDDRFGYWLKWRDVPLEKETGGAIVRNRVGGRNTLGLSGDNDSETLTLSHAFNHQTHLSQSISHLHHGEHLLYQGDISHQFDNGLLRWAKVFTRNNSNGNGSNSDNGWEHIPALNAVTNPQISNQISLGYSLYNNHVGWQADWQLAHRNGVDFSMGYQHRYVGGISNVAYEAPVYDVNIDQGGLVLPLPEKLPWGQENYLYVQLSFDMFKAPKQPLRLGRAPIYKGGNVMVTLQHDPQPVLDAQTMRFTLNDQAVQANLLNAKATRSQYIIPNIKAGDYILALDGKNLPIEYSTSILDTPRVRVSHYAPTSVPIELQKTYGISAKLAGNHEGVEVKIYQQNELLQTVQSGSYGYFQVLGLAPNVYTLKAKGYQPQTVTIVDDFVMQVEMQPNLSVP